MTHHLQYRTENGWKISSFSRSFQTADEAWKHAASLDQDGLIMPDVRVIGPDRKPVPRPATGMYQAELMGL